MRRTRHDHHTSMNDTFKRPIGRYQNTPIYEVDDLRITKDYEVQHTLRKPEIKRDPEGRFERHGKSISKTQKVKTRKVALWPKCDIPPTEAEINKPQILQPIPEPTIGTGKRGPGRPKGSQNKTTMALKEAILAAAEDAGGEGGMRAYLKTLAIENSSAFAGLLGKVLPSTLAMPESNGGVREKVTFERVIVWPDGHREIDQQVTPKQLPAPTVRKTDIDDTSSSNE
jgi:hypothetical protein